MIDQILGKLEGVKKVGNNGSWQAICPAHNDKNPSLTITEGEDGRVLLKCHANCKTEDILEAKGLTWADLFPEKEKTYSNNSNGKTHTIDQIRNWSNVEAVYEYRDKKNLPYILVIRKTGAKREFLQYSYIGDGKYKSGLNGQRPVLYRLPELLKAIQNNKTIYIAEGEKDVNNLYSIGLTATTNPMGAGKWRKDYNKYFKGVNVVIFPDNDAQGQVR